MASLFTIGYEKRSLNEYIEILLAADISVLVDVRQTPWSYKPGFSKRPLAEACEQHGIVYVHAQFAGNPKELRTNASSHAQVLDRYREYLDAQPNIVDQFEALVGEYLAEGANVCLTCFERHHDDCHRAIVAEAWADRSQGRSVRHLSSGGCVRLVSPRLQMA